MCVYVCVCAAAVSAVHHFSKFNLILGAIFPKQPFDNTVANVGFS